ncbi:ABC transporter permease [Tuwongella immobilis]|uniref:ABC-2 type transporter transmembrane domain-containing protein n=1 Tax=Tuwongella immobilis TaxID=692036 RepID=A0A6C2YNZ7_9BACT|nr:ABC transporter permease [Tuwongella immobilis]VIP02919.1 Uncharacterized protein OS=Isosphaera pallida (strain ATCC 43644 / DSM 9630 / IS1B) GN=Isop_2732 PE=4 SV=1: ABC2_membrane_3 [Tuwongella immobilis]VTS02845.1 Uncharacterized protein OS=Isosphaera pallida (strain ATCC 43644 / DSM 9630 / IS1B) GN=Isop_2732 PE=4 SV=1: ABC2_membrane_3 [Tuwongella immobilis]
MSRWQQLRVVGLWEFRRFFRIRDQILALAMAIVAGVVTAGITKFVEKSGQPIRIAVIHEERMPGITDIDPKTILGEKTKITLEKHPPESEPELRTAIEKRELDGIAKIESDSKIQLVVFKRPIWDDQLKLLLTVARTQSKMKQNQIGAIVASSMLAPPEIDLAFIEEDGKSGRPQLLVASLLSGACFFAVFLSLAFLLVGITSEKQIRVTEQVVSAISPQTWIDGKVLGLTGVALATVFTYALAGAIFLIGLAISGTNLFAKLSFALSPGFLILNLVIAALGLFFWNFFIAAYAATINDPNTSSRSSLMFLFMLPMGIAFMGFEQPDSLAMRILTLVPGTSITVLPMRLVLGTVEIWEVMLSILLLIGATLALRRLAGKIFAMGILMVGKEPSMKEIWQTLRKV